MTKVSLIESGKAAVIGYWTALAESWEMLSSKTEAIVSEGDRVVWIGRVHWRHRRTLRTLETPKIDVWTVWQDRAIRYYEMVDSAIEATRWAVKYRTPVIVLSDGYLANGAELEAGSDELDGPAHEIRNCVPHLFDEDGLASFPKTTGNRGIHVHVPLVAGWDYLRIGLKHFD